MILIVKLIQTPLCGIGSESHTLIMGSVLSIEIYIFFFEY